ncbi:response regulator [Palleronia sediminis]|uniref:DNA-binding transcriptional regulator NtrC n=1 Tax=Palleronia sediminis TaxID=2547833 RepID=A0A4R6AM40_9RHOB|nr:response regulator [Palleronia sediminis]TDL83598.1 response regulator [Palleronia sediminis]
MDGTVLVADDDRTIRTVLAQALTRAGCKVHATASMVTLLRWVEEGKGDLVISDVVMPDGNGLEAMPRIAALRPGLPVIVISARNTIRTAIEAAEAEAFDYLPKPFDLPDLMKRAARALSQGVGTAPATQAAPPAEAAADLPLVGRAPAMQTLYRMVARIMNSDLAVLVTGESGAGKSLVARAIHDFSDRRARPFVVAGAGDLAQPETAAALLARARSGTILFDEAGDLSPGEQARLVRLLDALDPEGGPRIMATTQADLGRRIEAGGFRADLFYRLGGVALHVPPLRERVEDIPLLAEHFLARAARDGHTARSLSDGAAALVRRYAWPGNVRQLENAMQRLAVTGNRPEIARDEMEAVLGGQPAAGPLRDDGDADRLGAGVARHLRRYFDLHGGSLPAPGLYARILREVETPLIEIALDATNGNQAKCAELLGINRNTLRKKITDLDIQVARRRKLM